MKYKSIDKKTVTQTIAGDATFTNYYPVSISLHSLNVYVYGNKAHTAAVWRIEPLGIFFFAITHLHHTVHGYPNGKKTYTYWFGS